MNPALAARIILMTSFPTLMTAWTAPGTSGVDAVSTATPLALIAEGKLGELPNYMDMFLGNRDRLPW